MRTAIMSKAPNAGRDGAWFSPEIGADFNRLVRAGLNRTEAARVLGIEERRVLAWQHLGRQEEPWRRHESELGAWVDSFEAAVRFARRGNCHGAGGALVRGGLKIALAWRWTIRPRLVELVRQAGRDRSAPRPSVP